jgi:myo-inositol-1(or 4)-monophosphatase
VGKQKLDKAPALTSIRNTAVTAAHAAGDVLTRYFGKILKISEKKGAGLVTNADFEAQDQAVKILRKKFPDFGFLTEEAKPEVAHCPGRWIIDPLDGTTNFVHGFPMFCVSIAAEWNGEIVVGVIYHPILKDTYTAIRGKGAFLNGRRLQTSKSKTVKDALLTTGFTYRKDEHLKSEMEAFERLSGIARAIRRPGSAALDLAYTARGVFDGFWERRLSPWDVAAGGLIVQEAGGKVSDFKGGPFKIDAGEILASNSLLHKALLKEISGKKTL